MRLDEELPGSWLDEIVAFDDWLVALELASEPGRIDEIWLGKALLEVCVA